MYFVCDLNFDRVPCQHTKHNSWPVICSLGKSTVATLVNLSSTPHSGSKKQLHELFSDLYRCLWYTYPLIPTYT